jgi:hypothetical protein
LIDDSDNGPPTITMMFGSGPVQAVVATDNVTVGSLKTRMKEGILLMTDHRLNIKGKFEGILGLGIPSSSSISSGKRGLYRKSNDGTPLELDREDSEEKNKTKLAETAVYSLGGPLPAQHAALAPFGANPFWSFPGIGPDGAKNIFTAPDDLEDSQRPETTQNGTEVLVKGLLEVAGISRFSICFNNGAPGVLRLGTPIQENRHGSIGQIHWGLDFRGISVGSHSAPVKFCRPEDMKAGQTTPCGGIPDSGTTSFMAPRDHLTALYESLCDEWPRCAGNFSAMKDAAAGAKKIAIDTFGSDPWEIHAASKYMIFQRLMFDCQNWLDPTIGLDELPTIHLHIAGSNGTKETLNVRGWAWVIETHEKDFKYVYKNVPGIGKMPVGKNYTGTSQKVCSPAFSEMEYNTEMNGPVWILGTPIFYEYQVHYDMQSNPPGISFADTPCGSCDDKSKEQALMSRSVSVTSRSTNTDSIKVPTQPLDANMRQADGPWREPRLDFSKPL